MRDPRDPAAGRQRSQVNIDEPYEAAYWTKTLGVPMEVLALAVRAAGTSPEAVRRHLAARTAARDAPSAA